MQSENVERLWLIYSNTGDSSIKTKIIENYFPLVRHIVSRMNVNLPSYLEYEDLISYGIFGLMQAVERYDAKKGIKFETYAYARIKGSIIDELRKIDWVPQGVRKKARKLQNAFSELEQHFGRSISDEDICDYFDITKEELQKTYAEIAALYGILSFDELIGYEATDKPSNLPDVQAEKEEIKDILGNAINKLPPREKQVVTLYYYEGLNFKEIAQVLELTQGRISQLHTKSILRLRGHLSKKRLRP